MKFFISIVVLIVILVLLYLRKQKKDRENMVDDKNYIEPKPVEEEEIS